MMRHLARIAAGMAVLGCGAAAGISAPISTTGPASRPGLPAWETQGQARKMTLATDLLFHPGTSELTELGADLVRQTARDIAARHCGWEVYVTSFTGREPGGHGLTMKGRLDLATRRAAVVGEAIRAAGANAALIQTLGRTTPRHPEGAGVRGVDVRHVDIKVLPPSQPESRPSRASTRPAWTTRPAGPPPVTFRLTAQTQEQAERTGYSFTLVMTNTTDKPVLLDKRCFWPLACLFATLPSGERLVMSDPPPSPTPVFEPHYLVRMEPRQVLTKRIPARDFLGKYSFCISGTDAPLDGAMEISLVLRHSPAGLYVVGVDPDHYPRDKGVWLGETQSNTLKMPLARLKALWAREEKSDQGPPQDF